MPSVSSPSRSDDSAVGLQRRLELELTQRAPGLLRSYPPAQYVQRLDESDRCHAYDHIPEEVLETCGGITRRHGRHTLALLHRLLIAHLIARRDERIARHRLPDSVRVLLRQEHARILSESSSRDEEYFDLGNELFVKDLALCRLKLLPCGSEAVEQWSGVPRRILLCGGPAQLVRAAAFMGMRVGGFWPLYESHWDRRYVRGFNRREYDLCYLRIAELLRLNPEVRGMFGASWWLDPQVDAVAPELSFLRRVPLEAGARLLRVGSDAKAVANAITLSRKRRELYEAGRFTPTRYMLVWARQDMLRWAERVSCGLHS